MNILNSFFESLIFGAAVYLILTVASNKLRSTLGEHIDKATEIVIIGSGGCLVLLLFVQTMMNSEDEFSMINRMFGPYWFWYWAYPFAYLVGSQLFWFASFKSSTVFRFIIGLVFLIMAFYPDSIILITSFHRDFLPSSFLSMGLDLVYRVIVDLLIYVVVVAIISSTLKKGSN